MTLLTTTGVAVLRPEDVGDLVVRPVQAASVAMQAATVVTTSATDFRIPVVADDPAAAWVAEGDEITPSDATLAEVTVVPTKVAGLSIISRELAEDSSPAAANVVGQGLARDIARKVDGAFFGTVAAPAPSGLPSLVGVTAVTGPAAWANLDPFAEAISEAEQVGAVVTAFIANPADALALSQLKDETGSARPLLGIDATNGTQRRLLGVPLLVSASVAEGTVWGIPRDRVLVVLRSDTRIETSSDAYFSSDRVGIRATMRVGFGFPHPAAVVKVALSG